MCKRRPHRLQTIITPSPQPPRGLAPLTPSNSSTPSNPSTPFTLLYFTYLCAALRDSGRGTIIYGKSERYSSGAGTGQNGKNRVSFNQYDPVLEGFYPHFCHGVFDRIVAHLYIYSGGRVVSAFPGVVGPSFFVGALVGLVAVCAPHPLASQAG